MPSSDHERLRRIFDRVIDAPPAERAVTLERECAGDAVLRQRVEAMISAAEDERFLGSPTAEVHPSSMQEGFTVDTPARSSAPRHVSQNPVQLGEKAGSRIGPYKLLQLIGEGGFGSVFMAEQEKPVARKVALKIIKLGMDTRQVVARFEQERQALAMMDHPNVARVLDAGATEAGRPFFVMELVKGDPISDYCDRNNLSIEERLELFAQVCQAVQHAHTKGIIHRDIKPSNILVSTQDGKPAAKVIDFGIAKATASKLTEKTLFTEHRQLIGTPEYMSPEQAEGSLDIDTRTDVYSLGVLLYELLTGSTPFDSKSLRSAAYAEIQRIIRDIEPPRPSTRLSQNQATLASVAASRRTEPRKLGSIVRSELDWIVMKALEKDRSRRYETANGLALDIRRYLSGEPVVAAPPSTAYRFKKFVRRNRGIVTAGAAVAAALVLGIVGFAWQATIADRARDRAVAAEVEAKKRADELAQVSRFQAEMLSQVDPTRAGVMLSADVKARYAAALEKAGVAEGERGTRLKAFAGEWVQVNATDAAQELIVQTILRPAVEAVDRKFADQPLVAAALRQTLAERYHRLGLFEGAMPLQERALAARRKLLGDDHPDTLESISTTGELLLEWGKPADAEKYFTEALERSRRALGEDSERTIIAISDMGMLLQDQGKQEEAEKCMRQALEKSRRVLGPDYTGTIHNLGYLGLLLRDEGKLDESEKLLRECLEKSRKVLGEDDINTLDTLTNLGITISEQGKLVEAEPFYRETLERSRRVLGEEHPDTLVCMNNMGVLLMKQKKWSLAEPYIREVLDKQIALYGDEHPNVLMSTISLGGLRTEQGRFDAAVEVLSPAESKMRAVFTGDNERAVAAFLVNLGKARTGLGKYSSAEPNLLEAEQIYVRVRGETSSDTRECWKALANLYAEWNKAEPGKGHDAKAGEWKQRLAASQAEHKPPKREGE